MCHVITSTVAITYGVSHYYFYSVMCCVTLYICIQYVGHVLQCVMYYRVSCIRVYRVLDCVVC